jgi:hypothetical protein
VNAKSRWILVGSVLAIATLFYPAEITLAPDWTVRVVDQNGQSLPSVSVTEVWQHYSLEEISHEEEKVTAGDGSVFFPRRSLRASRFSRIVGCAHEFTRSTVHASCGPVAYVIPFKCDYGPMQASDTHGSDWTGWFTRSQKMSSQLVLRHCPAGATGIGCLPDSTKYYPSCMPSRVGRNP